MLKGKARKPRNLSVMRLLLPDGNAAENAPLVMLLLA